MRTLVSLGITNIEQRFKREGACGWGVDRPAQACEAWRQILVVSPANLDCLTVTAPRRCCDGPRGMRRACEGRDGLPSWSKGVLGGRGRRVGGGGAGAGVGGV